MHIVPLSFRKSTFECDNGYYVKVQNLNLHRGRINSVGELRSSERSRLLFLLLKLGSRCMCVHGTKAQK